MERCFSAVSKCRHNTVCRCTGHHSGIRLIVYSRNSARSDHHSINELLYSHFQSQPEHDDTSAIMIKDYPVMQMLQVPSSFTVPDREFQAKLPKKKGYPRRPSCRKRGLRVCP